MSKVGGSSAATHGIGRVLHAVVWSRWAFWLVLSWPAWSLLYDLWPQDRYLAETLHITGVLSAQLLVAALAITPATLILRRWVWGQTMSRWLLSRRRHVGLASAGYAVLHTAHYVRNENDIGSVAIEALNVEFLSGWIAMLIFLPLAATSNTSSIRAMGQHWKTLQRMAYVAAIAVFGHWFLFDRRPEDLYLWGLLLIVAKMVHVVLRYTAGPKRAS